MSKLAAPSKLEGAEAEANKAAALAKAEENLSDLKAGKLVKRSASASKTGVPREVMTEAIRLAKDVVKNEIRKAGLKISHVAPKEITENAKALVAADPSYVEMATEELAKRAAKPSVIDIKSIIKEDPKLKAKAIAAAAERKSQLSAKQAGKVAPRKPKGAGQQASMH
jgi:hypothetical protein